MGLLDLFKHTDINSAIEEFRTSENAFLIDVRSVEEYKEGHIPSSINVPLQNTGKIADIVKDKNANLFVYCFSGARSRQAVDMFRKMGYLNVKNIGGISGYCGQLER